MDRFNREIPGFFPMTSREMRAGLSSFLRQNQTRPIEALLPILEEYSQTISGFVETSFQIEGPTILCRQIGQSLRFPNPIPWRVYVHILCGYPEWLRRKYTLPGLCEVLPGDVVVDCGAFVGGFALGAAATAAELHLFEPSPNNHACAQENLAQLAKATVHEAGLFDRTGRLAFNIAESAVESSFFSPDEGQVIETLETSVFRLDDLVREGRIPPPDFVKIEAEGAEIEVFEGLGDLAPRNIAIDVHAERDGVSPVDTLEELLRRRGYSTDVYHNVLFAR